MLEDDWCADCVGFPACAVTHTHSLFRAVSHSYSDQLVVSVQDRQFSIRCIMSFALKLYRKRPRGRRDQGRLSTLFILDNEKYKKNFAWKFLRAKCKNSILKS